MIPGIPGRKIDTSSITSQLSGSLDSLSETIELTADRETIPTPISDQVVAFLKGHLDNVLGTPFTLKAGDQSAELNAEDIVPEEVDRTTAPPTNADEEDQWDE